MASFQDNLIVKPSFTLLQQEMMEVSVNSKTCKASGKLPPVYQHLIIYRPDALLSTNHSVKALKATIDLQLTAFAAPVMTTEDDKCVDNYLATMQLYYML